MNNTFLSSFLLATALVTVATAQDGARKITISPKVGAVGFYRSTQTQKTLVEAMGHESGNEIVTELQVSVDEVAADGTVKATATWLRLRGHIESPAGEMSFDTKKPDDAGDNPMLEGFAEGCAAIIGQKTALTFGPNGKLKDKKPLEDLANKLTDKLSGQAKMMFQGIVGAHVLETQAGVFGTFPSEPVATGGTWTDKREAGGRGGLNMQTEFTYKLSTATAEAYVLGGTGTITAAPAKTEAAAAANDDEEGSMMRNMMRDAKIKDGKVESEMKISRQDGLLVSSLSTSSMAIHMNSPMGGDEPFVVSVKTSTKIERFTPDVSKDGKEAPASPKK